MRILLRIVLPTIMLITLWGSVLFFGIINGWWHQSSIKSNNPDLFFQYAKGQIEKSSAGSVVMALVEQGKVYDEYVYSIDSSVDKNTAFQVASLSKWITAWGVMSLVDQGKLDLDEPISNYLTRWNLPPSQFNNDEVTVRLLLSHTAGLKDGLGYAGFLPGEAVQSLEESLTKASDASPGASGEVKVTVKPGEKWIYSGGGYTLLQLLVEEVNGKSFQDYMSETLFVPLEMNNSTFIWDDSARFNLAKFYDQNGSVTPHLRYTSLAATSLYTSLQDMETFIQAHFEGSIGQSGGRGRGVIKEETLDLMKQPHGYQMGAAIWGLGTMLYASNNQGDYIIGHDGKNEPAINTAVRLDPDTGDGIVILEMGSPLLATEIGSEWVLWKTGNVDTLLFASLLEPMFIWFCVGTIVIILIVISIYFLKRKRS